MTSSEELFQRSLKIAPGGVHSPVRAFKSVGGTPLFFEKSEGAYLTSVEGKRYIDYCQSFGPMLLGHRDPDVKKAVQNMVDTAWCLGTCEPYSLELAEWVTSRLSWIEKIRFVNSGTEAVMSALRVARAATKRSKILKFDGCYHGHVDSMLVKSGSGLAGEASSDSLGVGAQAASETLVANLDDESSLEKIFKTHGSDIAAVILEPLPANYGLLVQRPEFVKYIFEMAHKHGALVIFDEVISGFRVALGGMAEKLNVKPDLVTYGKVLGGGFNVAAYGGRQDLMDLVAPSGGVYQAGTLSANPIGMVAGLATLKKIEKEKVYQTLERTTEKLTNVLNQVFQKKDVPFKVDHYQSVFWIRGWTDKPIRSLKDIPADHVANFKKLFHACLERGLYLAPSGYEVGFVSAAHTDDVVQKTIDIFSDALESVF
ncbi:MAG: glutamate-1-semialdehyde 2,1-aminomutase [Bdellovibrionales bacterium]